jgi:predicted metal-dependent hydrolase
LIENGFEEKFGFGSKKEAMFDEMSKKITKYENNIPGFFADSIKMFKFASDKMIKKISKLYDMADDSSTIQYDLHNKISSKDKKFETTILKFENFNTDAKLHLDDVKSKLSDKLSSTNWFKGDVNDRVEQLVNIHSKYIEVSYNVLSIDAIVNSLFDYERILKLGM